MLVNKLTYLKFQDTAWISEERSMAFEFLVLRLKSRFAAGELLSFLKGYLNTRLYFGISKIKTMLLTGEWVILPSKAMDDKHIKLENK